MVPETAFATMDAQVATIAEGERPSVAVASQGPRRFSIRGSIPAGHKPVVKIYEVEEPAAFARALFIEALRRRGVEVSASPLAEKHVAAEVEALTVLGAAGTPARIEVPKVIRAGRWQGVLVLVMTSLDTSVWQRPRKQWELPTSVMDALHGHFAGHPQPLVQTPMWKSMGGSALSRKLMNPLKLRASCAWCEAMDPEFCTTQRMSTLRTVFWV